MKTPKEPKISSLKECDFCKNGIGKVTYKSSELEGEYCSSNCYFEAMAEKLGILKYAK